MGHLNHSTVPMEGTQCIRGSLILSEISMGGT